MAETATSLETMQLTIERKIQIGFAIAVFIIVAVGAAALRSTAATVESAGWVAHTLEVRAELEATFADLIACGAADPAHEAVTTEFTTLVAACMEKLEAGHREILTLRYALDYNANEIADVLAITVTAVHMRLSRARQRLAERLTAQGVVHHP